MTIYAAIIGVLAGICLGYSFLFLFVGLRRRQAKQQNLLFALFAFAYAGTLLMGIWYRGQTTVEGYLAISRWDGIFIATAFIALNWYVATYTAVFSKYYLWGITAVFILSVVAAMLTATLVFTTMPEIAAIPLPWNEQVNTLIGEENIWGTLLLLAQLFTLGFIIFAGVKQWRRGEQMAALLLLGGMSWFIFALFYEILAEAGLFVYVPLAESGFLGIAIALSLQRANIVIKTEEALAESQQQLETVLAQRTTELAEAQAQLIEQAQETAVLAERSRIARDLHDAVTQTIYSATLIVEVLPQVWQRNPDEGQRNLVKLRQLVRGALAEMRTMLFELRPAALEKAELDVLLPQLADAFTGRTRIPVEATINGQNHLPAEVKIAFYRITQETFNNIAKHAAATAVTLLLQQDQNEAQLTISDNGRGFDPTETPPESMGLAIMKERAQAVQATLEFISERGAGTNIQICWPNPAHPPNGETT